MARNEVAGVECAFRLPGGFRFYERLVPNLVYPLEFGAVANVDLPPTEPDSPHDSRPRVDLLPARGAVLWMVLGNIEGERASDQEHRELFKFRPKGGGRKEGVAALGDGDRVSSRWENTRTWITVAALGESKYCQFFVYAGDSPRAPLAPLHDVMRSMRIEYQADGPSCGCLCVERGDRRLHERRPARAGPGPTSRRSRQPRARTGVHA